VMKAAVVQTIQAAACMEVPGKPGRPEARATPGCGADKDGDDVDAAEDAMELEVTLADPRGEIDGADQESEDSGECMGDEEMRSAMTCRR
jgi:hypothetical protein